MSTAQVIAPTPIGNNNPVMRTIGGLATVTTILNTGVLKRHSIAYIPNLISTTRAMRLPGSSSGTIVTSLFSGHNHKSNNSSSSSKRRSMDKAAEKDWKEQAKQVFQLSTVNDQGYFIPPPPITSLEKKGLLDENLLLQEDADRYYDYFATTIVNTPPERVRTLLSAESTISPGMFSSPSKSKIKRHTMPSLPSSSDPSPIPSRPRVRIISTLSSAVSTQPRDMNSHSSHSRGDLLDSQILQVKDSNIGNTRTTEPQIASLSSSTLSPPLSPLSSLPPTPADSLSTPPSSSPVVPASSPPTTPRPPSVSSRSSISFSQEQQQQQQQKQQQEQEEQQCEMEGTKNHLRRKARAQISFLTGATLEEEESDTLSDPFSSMSSSSPVDLVFNRSRSSMDSSSSSSISSSPEAWPRRRSAMLSTSSSLSPSPSLSSPQLEKERIWRINAQKLRAQNNF
ncbi:hypothetical protein BGZ65_010436 [Modicella reniformis]|uniref:Uncharacterized protein n=1 Tax=Modicella reniformis TaxID=1440133 RepID=A0A9P6IIE4_9FUNG|nr:hypothetical protein BGZ65_010436 [Modicella reniformis]